MSATQALSTWFDSRQIYSGLALDLQARWHFFTLEREGGSAVLEIFTEPRSILSRTILLDATGKESREEYSEKLPARGTGEFRSVATRRELLGCRDDVLETATMGTRLYVAGTESFIGEVIARAASFGVVPDSVIAERRGSFARRVQCVHCKHVTDDVPTSPYTCPNCGLSLLVRDHYSRRLAAFQGVRIDAEAPGEVPAAEEFVQ